MRLALCAVSSAATVVLIAASAWAQATPDPGDKSTGLPTPAPDDSVPDAPEAAPGDAAADSANAGAPALAPGPDAAPDARGDEAWARYHRAYAAAARGDVQRARAALAELLGAYPDHPAALAGRRVMVGMPGAGPGGAGTGGSGAVADEPFELGGPEKPTKGARAELALYQTLHGIALGAEVCIAIECDDGGAIIGLPLLGGGLGLAVSLGAFREVTPGHRAAINSGTSWGAFNAGMLLIITEPDDLGTVGASMIGGQLTGLALGHALWSRTAPTEGQIALANTFGIWGAVLTGLAANTLGVSLDDDSAVAAALIGGDAGLVAGGFVAKQLPRISRGRTLLMDAGGILGGLTGLGTAVIIKGDDTDDQLTSGLMLVGATLGLASAAYLGRNWDGPSVPGQLTLVPTRGGASAGVAFGF